MPSTKLITGNDVLHLVNTGEFIKNWQVLSMHTPGFTRLQEPEFVTTWYSIYANEFEPVVSVWLEEPHTPAALMCLAWDKKNKKLTHAGHKDAEYHGWLAKEKIELKFLNETFKLLIQHYDLKQWHWGWLPPGISDNALYNLRVSGLYLDMDIRNSLIWDLTQARKLQQVQKNRSFKSKMKKLRKRGDLKFREVSCDKELAELLEIVRFQSDFRFEALYDTRPFGDNPNRAIFEASLLKFSGIKHASGLWLGDKLIAFHLGIADEKRVCLGMSSFDPTEGYYSPGNLLLVELAAELTRKQFEIFDLTPGKDSYKERFANDKQLSSRPSFYFTPTTILKVRMRQIILYAVKKAASFLGLKMKTIKNWRDRAKDWNKNRQKHGLWSTLKFSFRGVFDISKKCFYRFDFPMNQMTSEKAIQVNKNHYWDLLKYQGSAIWSMRRDLLRKAIYNFNRGAILLSATNNDELCWHCWYHSPQSALSIPGYTQEIKLAEDAHILDDFYCPDPLAFNDYLESSLNSCNHLTMPIYVVLDQSLPITDQQFEGWAFRPVKKLTCFRILWFVRFIRESVIKK